MTYNEALRVFHHIPFYDTYAKGGRLDNIEDSLDYEKVINYLMSLDISVDDAIKFVEGNVNFATMDNKRTLDEYDYLEIHESGRIDCWTELSGNIYYLDEMNKTFKDYEPTEEEIVEQQRRDAESTRRIRESINKVLTDLELTKLKHLDSKLVEVRPIQPMNKGD